MIDTPAPTPEAESAFLCSARDSLVPSTIPGLKMILMGSPGTGKTHAIRTLIDAGLEVFCILTEPNAINTLMNMEGASDAYKSAIEDEQLHWNFIKPANAGWDVMKASANKLINFDLAALAKGSATDKKDHAQYLEVLNICADFKDELTGKSYGAVDEFDPQERVLVIDSLSGLNTMFLSMVCGSKPTKTLPEWGAAIDAELRFLDNLTFGIMSHVVLIAHITRTVDEVQGGIKTMVNGLGNKAPQEIPKNFTDCILAKRDADAFSWSTVEVGTETKATTLKFGSKLQPSFVPLINTWRERLALTQPK